MFRYKRPENSALTQVYYKFTAKDKGSEHLVNYRVQDLPEEYFEQTVQFLVKHFIPYEPMSLSLKGHENSKFLADFATFWRKSLSEKLSIACFKDDGSNDLVGVNVLIVTSRDETVEANDESYQDEGLPYLLSAVDFCTKKFDIFDHFQVDRYLSAYGLCVGPEYRGRGIATEILKARVPYMKAFGLQVTATAFTAIGSQAAAKKAGFEDIFAIPYTELEKMFPKFDFSLNPTKFYKTMALSIESSAASEISKDRPC